MRSHDSGEAETAEPCAVVCYVLNRLRFPTWRDNARTYRAYSEESIALAGSQL
jgi:hypothetical protein